MTSPFQYPDYNRELGVESPVFSSEWDAMMDRRRRLVDEISSRLQLANRVGSLEAADVAANTHQLTGQNEDGSPTIYQDVNREPTPHELNQLLGAAEFYGIANADKIPPIRLKHIVEQRRLATQQETAAQREGAGLGRKVGETFAEGLAAMGLGATQELLNVAQRLPFVGDAISRLKSVQEADQYLAQSSEGVTAGLSPEEASGFRTAKSIGGMVGYALPAGAAWKLAGAAGRIGFIARAARFVPTPWVRAAVQGSAAAGILETGGDQSNEERLFKVAMGGATGAAFHFLERAVPIVFEKVRSAFPTRSDPFYGEGGFGPQNKQTVDAEWYFEADQPQLKNPNAPLYDTPYYGPGQPIVGEPVAPEAATNAQDAIRVLPGMEEAAAAQPPAQGQQQVYGVIGAPERPAGLLMSPERAALQERINGLVEQRDLTRRQLETDPLTGGGNRAALMRAQEGVDADPQLSWVVFDGKQFKAVNDNFGHQTGDQVLSNFGRAIQQAAGELQVPARFFRQGGDEFAAIVPTEHAAAFAKRASELSYQRLSTQDGTTVATRLDSYHASTFADADLKLMQNKRGAPSAGTERIVSAAIKSPVTGKIYTGQMHEMALDAAFEAGEGDLSNLMTSEHGGYLTSKGRFVLDDEAEAIANAASQVTAAVNPADRIHSSQIAMPQNSPAAVAQEGRFWDHMAADSKEDIWIRTFSETAMTEADWENLRPLVDRSFEDLTPEQQFALVRTMRGDMGLHPDTPLLTQTPEKFSHEILSVENAAQEGAQLAKQTVVMEAGNYPALAGASEIGNPDVVQAQLEKYPASISVIRGIGDASKTVRQLVQAQSEQRLMPHTFRFVQRGESMDLLISNGLPISNKRADQYKQYGFFEGQRAIYRGSQVTISKPGPDFTTVRENGSGTEITSMVQTRELLPLAASDPVEHINELFSDAPRLYDNFQAFVMTQMDAGGRAMGLDIMDPNSPAAWDWLSHETSTQLPRMLDEFLDAKRINNPAVRQAIEAYFNVRRTADYRALAPAEAAEHESLVKELNTAVAAKPPVALPIEDIAGSKGFAYVPTPQEAGGTLVDRLSDLRVPVDSPEAALEFLRSFQREVPDYTPLDEVPMELGDSGPHAASPADNLDPVFEGGEEQVYSSAVRQLGRVERAVEGALRPREPVPPSGGAVPPPPPPPPPPSLGGSNSPQLPPGERSLGAAFETARRQRPADLYRVLQELDSAWLRYAEPFRRVTLRVQDALKDIGIEEGTLWKHYSDLVTAIGEKHNAEHPWMAEASDIFSGFRRKYLRDGTVTRIQEISDFNQKLAAMQRAGYTSRERAAQARLADFNDRFWSHVVDLKIVDPQQAKYVFGYMSQVRMRQGMPGVSDPYADPDGILPKNLEFFASFAREGNIQFRQMDARTLTTTMIRAAMFQKHAAAPYEQMVRAWDDPRVPTLLRGIVTDWLRVVRTGHNPEYDMAIQGVRYVLNKMGVPITDGEVAGMWNGLFSNLYRARLGGRPDVIFRDAISPFLAGTRIGFAPVTAAYNRWLNPTERAAMIERGNAGGWVEQGMVRSPIAEVFEAPIQTPEGLSALPPHLVARREGLARIGDAMYDLLPPFLRGGIQGTKLDPLLPYTKLNEMNRYIAGDAGWDVASKAIANYQFEMGRLLRGEIPMGGATVIKSGKLKSAQMLVDAQDFLMKKLMGESQADVYPKPIQEEFRRLIADGDMEGAANLLGREAANSQFRYGSKEGSIGIRQMGTTGRAAMTFGSFTQQYVAFMREQFGPHVPTQKRVAMALRHGSINAILGLAGAYTGWRFGKWMWHQSLTFGGGPMATSLYDLYQSTTGRIAQAVDQPLSPQQTDALARAQRTTIGEDVANTLAGFFPYTSTIQTANRLVDAAGSVNPIEGTVRQVVTGDRGLGSDFRQYFNDVIVHTPDDIDAAIQGDNNARAGFTAEELQFLESVRNLPREQRYRAYAAWRDSRVSTASPYSGSSAGAGARY